MPSNNRLLNHVQKKLNKKIMFTKHRKLANEKCYYRYVADDEECSQKRQINSAKEKKAPKSRAMVQLFYYENRGKCCRKLWKHDGDKLKVSRQS